MASWSVLRQTRLVRNRVYVKVRSLGNDGVEAICLDEVYVIATFNKEDWQAWPLVLVTYDAVEK